MVSKQTPDLILASIVFVYPNEYNSTVVGVYNKFDGV